MPKFYFYKLTVDDGSAPCVQNDFLSLAICKPMIRSTADVGDFILGFAANSLSPDNRLIYVARVTDKLTGGAYWAGRRFADREDCIYEWRRSMLILRPDAKHHRQTSYLERDLGPHPFYSRGSVLVSDDFRYFGAAGTCAYKDQFPLIKEAVERLGQGHRVWHTQELAHQLESLKDFLWAERSERVVGEPSGRPGHRESDHGSEPRSAVTKARLSGRALKC